MEQLYSNLGIVIIKKEGDYFYNMIVEKWFHQ